MRYRYICPYCGAGLYPGERCICEDLFAPDEEIRASCTRPIRRAISHHEDYGPDAYVARPGREIVL